MVKLKDLLKEWNDTSFKDLPKRWSKAVMKGRETDGLTEFERLGGTDLELGKVYTDKDRPPFKAEFIDLDNRTREKKIDEKMSDEKRAFLMLKIYGQSWSVNMGKIFAGINREKPTMIKKGLKVRVLTGKDKKKEGEVIEIDRPNNRAKVKEINMVKKHVKTTKEKKGGIVSKESFIHLSNLKLIDEKAAKKTEAKK